MSGKEIMKMKVVDESKGIIKIAWIEETNDDLRFATIIVQILKGNEWLYFNVIELEGKKVDNEYYWGVLKQADGNLIGFMPSVEKFVEAAKSKIVDAELKTSRLKKGEVTTKEEPDQIFLNDKPDEIIKLVENGGYSYFDVDHPVIFVRLNK